MRETIKLHINRNNLLGIIGLAILILLMFAPSHAVIIRHGDIMSENYTFMDLTEDNLEPNAFYGNFSTVSDRLIVDPMGFGVQVNPGPGAALLDSELEMMIVPKNATSSVDVISFSESGDYTNNILSGSNATVSANAPYFWQIVEVDGNSLSNLVTGNGVASFSSMANGTEIWTNTAMIELSAALDAAEAERGVTIGDRITKVNFRFDNTLTAQAGENSTAFIKKKEAGGVQIGVHTIPEPSGIALVLVGLLGLSKLGRC